MRLKPYEGLQIPDDFKISLVGGPGGVVFFGGELRRGQPRDLLSWTLDLEAIPLDFGEKRPSLTCRVDGLWCPSVDLPWEAAEAYLPVFPSTRFRVAVEASGETADEVTIQGWLQGRGGESLELRLPSNDGSFEFAGPRVPLDLRLAVVGHQPLYLWDLLPSGPHHDLGLRRLVQGSSVCGFALDDESGRVVEAASVRLLLPHAAQLPPIQARDAERRLKLARQVTTNGRGFFQITGVEPGLYRLELEAPGEKGPAAVLDPIRVLADSETCFPQVWLAREAEVIVGVVPPVDPTGQAWQVIARRDAAEVLLEPDDEGGYRGSLPRGRHEVWIQHRSGDVVGIEEVEVEGREARIDLPLELMTLSGQVLLGTEPMEAQLRVVAGHGDSRRLETDAEGRFSDWVRRPKLPVLSVYVSPRAAPTFERRLWVRDLDLDEEEAEILLRLREGSIDGRVLWPDGAPVAEAAVLARSEDLESQRATTDGDGRFVLRGLERATWKLSASWQEAAWGPEVEIDLTERGEASELTLELEEMRQVAGRVLNASGEPVAGARVGLRIPPPVPAASGARTDVEGRFSLRVPIRASQGVLTVSGPVLWSGCVELPQVENAPPIAVSLPLSGGEARIRLSKAHGAERLGRGSYFLVTADGGFLSPSRIAAWTRSLGFPLHLPESGGFVELRAPGLAPGPYALVHSSEVETAFSAGTCSGSVAGTRWKLVAPGGVSTFQEEDGPGGSGLPPAEDGPVPVGS